MCVSVKDCVVLVGLSQQGTESSSVCVCGFSDETDFNEPSLSRN